jgi:hypothetical protein
MKHAFDHHNNAGDVAQSIARLVVSKKVIGEQAAMDLRRLLMRDLAHRTPGQVRIGHLGLLLELICSRRYEWVSQTIYMNIRAERVAAGQTWPDDSQIIRLYGHWHIAYRVAEKFMWIGDRSSRPPRDTKGRTRRYSAETILMSIHKCRSDLGSWPTQWEYSEWVRLTRLLSAKDPNRPDLPAVVRNFGSYPQALHAAKNWDARDARAS